MRLKPMVSKPYLPSSRSKLKLHAAKADGIRTLLFITDGVL